MRSGFNIVRMLDNGELLPIAWRRTAEQARQTLRDLAACWPGEYGIQEASESVGWMPYINADNQWLN